MWTDYNGKDSIYNNSTTFCLSTRNKDKLSDLWTQDPSSNQEQLERKERERERGKKLLTFLCSVEGRTSSKGLLESWIAYPASLGVRTLTFSSLTYTKKFTTEERKPEIHLKHQLPWTEANRSESKFICHSHILQFKLRFLGPIMGFGQN